MERDYIEEFIFNNGKGSLYYHISPHALTLPLTDAHTVAPQNGSFHFQCVSLYGMCVPGWTVSAWVSNYQ